MSTSNRAYSDTDDSKIELPVFITPSELVFSSNKRRSLLTVFNPYGNDAQFRIMTTSPERFDVSLTKGTIKPNRRIDISIRLLSYQIDEELDSTEEQQTIDYFRIIIQVGSLKGNKPIKVYWCANEETAELLDDSHARLMTTEDRSSKLKLRPLKQPHANTSLQLGSPSAQSSQRIFSSQRLPGNRPNWSQVDYAHNGSNVNLICTLCAIACVITLFFPLAIDSELCKKAKTNTEQASTSPSGIMAQLSFLLSVSYEMKLGCSFALGLFTYRLISTMPD